MSTITAADVKKLRERTGLPLMDCKKALMEANGDQDLAVEELRKRGQAIQATRSDRETTFGRFGLYRGTAKSSGAMVELQCESAPVAGNEEFIQLANDLAERLATGPGAATAEELLDQPSPSKKGLTLREQRDDLFNRIREVFNVKRMHRYNTGTGGYCHNLGTVSGVLVSVEGGDDETAKDVSMHIAAMKPTALTVADLDPAAVAKEREILVGAALAEGKPKAIVEKMVDGRLKNFFKETVLLEQLFVKDDKQTIAQLAASKNMKILGYTHWELGSKHAD